MAQRRRLKPNRMSIMRCLITCALVTAATLALLTVHVLPSFKAPSYSGAKKLSKVANFYLFSRWDVSKEELRWTHELAPPQLSKFIGFSRSRQISQLDRSNWATSAEFEKLWKSPPSRGFVPCVAPGSSYSSPGESRGYFLVHANGGLNQMKAGISDMVAVARLINATLVIPKLDKNSFWQDKSKFADVFDEEHFIASLLNDVKIVKKLPPEFAKAKRAVKYFTSWSSVEYYQGDIYQLWDDHQVIRAAKSDARLANNNLPPEIQKLRCRTFFEALRFAPPIEALGKLLVDRMKSIGPYIALHLRYEKDMLAFSGCTYGLSQLESDELAAIRENITHWKVKEIDPSEQRARGYCPLTPKEVGLFLSSLGYPSNTPIYIAAGEIYGGQARMADLESRFPMLMSKEILASEEELRPFSMHASQMAALDYIVSVESDVFVPSYSGNMARAVEGHRRFLGHRKTIIPDRKALVRLFDKVDQGMLSEGNRLSDKITEIHRRRQGSPRKRKGPISGTKGRDRFRSEEVFYENPLPDCLCQSSSSDL
ncbi:hypothetical protein LUZ61_004165 [Rhynchospora tenuis]|uniref:O-fucosyltransferase family protein n=1 Tax=Rhynchospora tenuis TaxID=198213 RepID=A0AAD5ZM51_9POAL|nr:hypothetical protein LUZ61_004165 [Rhynchospora tenuis]